MRTHPRGLPPFPFTPKPNITRPLVGSEIPRALSRPRRPLFCTGPSLIGRPLDLWLFLKSLKQGLGGEKVNLILVVPLFSLLIPKKRDLPEKWEDTEPSQTQIEATFAPHSFYRGIKNIKIPYHRSWLSSVWARANLLGMA